MTREVDPVLGTLFEDPYPFYRVLRRDTPVLFHEGFRAWLVSRHADVAAVLRDKHLSSRRVGAFMAGLAEAEPGRFAHLEEGLARSMIFRDPPDHTRLRALVTKAFSPASVQRVRPRVEALVGRLLDDAAVAGRLDVVGDLAYPLTASVILVMLGVPAGDWARMRVWADEVARFLGTSRPTAEQAERMGASGLAFGAYCAELIAERRAHPEDDLVSALIAAEEASETLTTDEIGSVVTTLLFAGHETTAHLIGNGLLALLRHPDQVDRLLHDPALWPRAVEELLRYDAPVQMVTRIAVEPHELAGHHIEAGQRIVSLVGSANRDPDVFVDPERLDVSRQDNRHLSSFGHGIHTCLGAALARLEAQIALSTLFGRYPRLQLDEDAPLRWRRTFALRGLEALPVVL